MKKCVYSILLVVVFVFTAFGQTTTGRLEGTVSGPDGFLPGATILVKDNQTGKEKTTISSSDGSFLLPQLEFGTYTVTITADGFKTFVANEVKIDVGRNYTLAATLQIGDVQEVVTVEAGADIISASTAQISNTVSPQQILSLPLITRNPLSLTTLQAGVASNSAQNTTINGMRTTFTNITRDGINIQDTFIRSNATDFAPGRPSVDDTGEFTISTSNSEADQGYGGAQIRLVTPRGQKDFHGALFAYNRNSEFAANSFFNNRNGTARSFRNRNQFGGKISGPMPLPGFGEGGPMLYKDKGFFFFAYEGIRDPLSTAATRTILTPGARGGAFSWARTNSTSVTPFCPSQSVGSICTIPDILGYARSTVTNGSQIPATVSPIISSRVISQLPNASNFTGGDGLNTAGYRLLRKSTQERDQYSSRVDVDINDRNTVSFIYNYNNETNLRPDADTTAFGDIPGVTQASKNKQFTAAYRRTISSTFTTEVRGGIFTSEVPFDRTDPIPDYYLSLPLVTFPENTFMSQGRNTKAINLQSNSDLVVGSHTFRFGAQAQVFKVNSYNDAGLTPTITVGTGTATPAFTSANFSSIGGISTTQLGTANGLIALLGGGFVTASQSFNVNDIDTGYEATRPITPFRYENHSLYVADRWLVKTGLTLSLGLRYELFPALRLNNGLALEPVIADLKNPEASLLNINGMTDVIGGNAGRKNAYYKTDWNNLAPNLGVAWSPSYEGGIGKFLFGSAGRSVLRAGYSHAYGNDSIVTSINNSAVGNPGLARTTFSLVNLNGRLDTGVPTVTPGTFIAPPRTYLENNRQNTFFGTVFGIDPYLKTPMVKQYNFGFQREFFGNTAFEVRYVGSRSDNLARGVDLNQIDIFSNGFLADFERARANLALTGNAFCTTTGCQPLSIFLNTNNPQPGRLVVGTGGISLTTFNNNLNNGTPADLALSYINSSANLNNHPSSLNPSAVPRINFLANPAAGAVDYFVNDAYYRYDSLQIEVRRRFSQGLYFQANYTFSKNLTNAVGTSQALFEPYLDNNDKSLDKQRADFDQTHVFNFNGVYQLPFGKGRSFLDMGGVADKVFGGWEISGLAQWTSGAPITFVDTRGTLNRSGRSARQTVNSSLTNDQIRALAGVFEANGNIYWINPSVVGPSGAASGGFGSSPFSGQAFFNTDPGSTGNLGRALIDGPGYFNINAAVLKSITFGEKMRVQLRAEAFNVLNNVNFVQNTQLANISSTSFGQVTGTFSPREIQFAARFEF